MPFHLRPATIDDLDRIIAIEIAAGELFRTIGMDLIADDAPPSRSALLAQVRSEELIVAESRGTVAGYLLMGRADGTGHLHQLSVDPGFGRQGAGTALVAAAAAWAERRGLNALTLTTFTEVPWNGPWYRRLGFVEVSPDELGPQLRAIQIAEQAHGLTAAGGRAVLRRPTVGRGTQRAPASKSRSADPSAPTSPASTTVRACLIPPPWLTTCGWPPPDWFAGSVRSSRSPS